MKNIIHNIEPDLIQKNIQEKIEIFENLRIKAKENLTKDLKEYEDSLKTGKKYFYTPPEYKDYETIDLLYDEYIKQENSRYSTVKILEIKHTKRNYFFLIYESEDILAIDNVERADEYFLNNTGTGPFDTYSEAKDWFLKFGR